MPYEVKVVLNLEDNIKKKLQNVLNDFKQLEKTLSKVANIFDKVAKAYDTLSSASTKLNKQLKDTNNKLSSTTISLKNASDKIKETSIQASKTSSSIQNMNKSFQFLNTNLHKTTNLYNEFIEKLKEFWKRFGEVAFAFTILYRVFNLIENVIQSLINQIKIGITAFDEYVSAISRYALMLKMAIDSSLSFNQAMQLAVNTINNIRLASLNSLTGFREVITGLDELAQQGIYISGLLAKPFVDFVDLTVMIAQTTGSTVLQVRQELSALMTGSAKASNQMVRFLKNLGMTDKQIKEFYSKLLSMDKPAQRFAQLILYIDKYISKFKENLFSINLEKAANRFINLINVLSTFSIQLVNLQRTGNAFSNVFAQIFNNLYNQFMNKDIFDKINKLQQEIYQAIISNNLARAKELYSQITELQKQLFTEQAKQFIINMAHLYNLLADAIKGVVSISSVFIKIILDMVKYLDAVYQIIKKIVSILLDNFAIKQFMNILGSTIPQLLALSGAFFVLYKSVKFTVDVLKTFIILASTRLIYVFRTIGAVISTELLPVIAGITVVIGAFIGSLKLLGKWEGFKKNVKSAFESIRKEFENILGFKTENLQLNKLFEVGEFDKWIKKFNNQFKNLESIVNNLNNLASKWLSLANKFKSLGITNLKDLGFKVAIPEANKFTLINIYLNALKQYNKIITTLIRKKKEKGKLDTDEQIVLVQTLLDYANVYKQIRLLAISYDKLINKIQDFKTSISQMNLDNLVKTINQFIKLNKQIEKVLQSFSGEKIFLKESLKLQKQQVTLFRSLKIQISSIFNTLKQQFKTIKSQNIFDIKTLDNLISNINIFIKAIERLKTTPFKDFVNVLIAQAQVLKQNIKHWETISKLVNKFKLLKQDIEILNVQFKTLSADNLSTFLNIFINIYNAVSNLLNKLQKLNAPENIIKNVQKVLTNLASFGDKKIQIFVKNLQNDTQKLFKNLFEFDFKDFISKLIIIKKTIELLSINLKNIKNQKLKINIADALNSLNNLKNKLEAIINTFAKATHGNIKEFSDYVKFAQFLDTAVKNKVPLQKTWAETYIAIQKKLSVMLEDLIKMYGSLYGTKQFDMTIFNNLVKLQKLIVDLGKTMRENLALNYFYAQLNDVITAFELLVVNKLPSWTEYLKNKLVETANMFVNFVNNLFDSFVSKFTDFLFGVYKSFGDFINAFLRTTVRMLTEILLRILLIKALTGIAGSVSGANKEAIPIIGEGDKVILFPEKHATGGVVEKPTITWVAEAGQPEAIVPLPDGRSIPVMIKGMQSASKTNLNINVNIQALDAQSFLEYEKRTKAITNIIYNAISKDLKNNGALRNLIQSSL